MRKFKFGKITSLDANKIKKKTPLIAKLLMCPVFLRTLWMCVIWPFFNFRAKLPVDDRGKQTFHK